MSHNNVSIHSVIAIDDIPIQSRPGRSRIPYLHQTSLPVYSDKIVPIENNLGVSVHKSNILSLSKSRLQIPNFRRLNSTSRRQVADVQLKAILNEPETCLPDYINKTTSALDTNASLTVDDISKLLNTPAFIIERLVNTLVVLSKNDQYLQLNKNTVQKLIRVLNSTIDVRTLVLHTMFSGKDAEFITREEVSSFYEKYLASMKSFDKTLMPDIIKVLLQRYHLDTKSEIDFEEFYSIIRNDETLLQSFSQFTLHPAWFQEKNELKSRPNIIQRCFGKLSRQEKTFHDLGDKLSIEYVRNNLARIILLILYILANISLMIYVIIYRAAVNGAHVFEVFARIGGMLLNFNCALILVCMLKQTILLIRSNRILRRMLPVDDHIDFHKFIGRFIGILAVMHTIAHMANFGRLIEHFPWSHYMFTTNPNIGWLHGSASLTGIILCVILLAMIICSMRWVRRKGHFQVFYWTHLLYYPFIICLVLHGPNFWKWVIVPFTIFLLEKLYSVLKRYSSISGRTYLLSATIEQSNVLTLTIHRPKRFVFAPGDYIHINVPSIALYEFHPFTISTAPEEKNYLRVHIHAKGDWTKRLYQYFKDMSDQQGDSAPVKVHRADLNTARAIADQKLEVTASLESSKTQQCRDSETSLETPPLAMASKTAIIINGPYSSCARYIFDCKHVVLVGSGIGITPYASILSSIMARFRTMRSTCNHCQGVNYHGTNVLDQHRLQKVDFVWVNRDVKNCEWFINLLRQFEAEQNEYLSTSTDKRRFLDIHLYFTGIKKDENIGQVFLHHVINLWAEEVGNDIFTGLKAKTRYGRPEWDSLFKGIIAENGSSMSKHTDLFFCGPVTMGKTIQQHCRTLGMHYHEEKF